VKDLKTYKIRIKTAGYKKILEFGRPQVHYTNEGCMLSAPLSHVAGINNLKILKKAIVPPMRLKSPDRIMS
jgi:hypothetical protein